MKPKIQQIVETIKYAPRKIYWASLLFSTMLFLMIIPIIIRFGGDYSIFLSLVLGVLGVPSFIYVQYKWIKTLNR